MAGLEEEAEDAARHLRGRGFKLRRFLKQPQRDQGLPMHLRVRDESWLEPAGRRRSQ